MPGGVAACIYNVYTWPYGYTLYEVYTYTSPCRQISLSLKTHRPVPPTSTDSDTSVFIRNLRALYGYTETTLYYTEDLQSACTSARGERDYARPLPRGVSAAAAVRSLVSVVMVCRNLQMRATRVSRSS